MERFWVPVGLHLLQHRRGVCVILALQDAEEENEGLIWECSWWRLQIDRLVMMCSSVDDNTVQIVPAFVLSARGLTAWLRDRIARVGLATTVGNTKGSVIDGGVVSSAAVRVTDIISRSTFW